MEIMNGMRLSLASTTRPDQKNRGTIQQKVSQEDNPEFDTYAADAAKLKEKMEWFDRSSKLPINFLMDGTLADGTGGCTAVQTIAKAFNQYYDGALDEKGIESTLRDVVSNFRTSYINQGFDPDEFMPKLLKDVYSGARLATIGGVPIKGETGRELLAHYNGNERNSRDYIYYDAKYYYQSEEMKDKTIEMMQKISKEYGYSDLESPREYEDGDTRKGIYGSYNTFINNYARQQFGIGNMIDETMVPPKGFRFFYKGNDSGMNNYTGIPSSDGTPESHFDGILHVWYGDWSYVGRVPVRQDPTQFPTSVNMYEHIAGSGSDIPKEIAPMLKNFDFYTLYMSGQYEKTHPRKF